MVAPETPRADPAMMAAVGLVLGAPLAVAAFARPLGLLYVGSVMSELVAVLQ